MKISLKISNYRCFPEDSPAELVIEPGFTSFIGVNNSGKSAILKFFYEFRHLFQILSNPDNFIRSCRSVETFNLPQDIYDLEEIFNNRVSGDISLEVTLTTLVNDTAADKVDVKTKITILKGTNRFSTEVFINQNKVDTNHLRRVSEEGVLCVFPVQVYLLNFLNAFRDLSDTLYIGPFRNAINEGEKNNYYDLQIGEAFIRRWKELKEGKNKKQKEAAVELEEELRRIFEFEQLQVNPSDDCKTLSILVDRKSYMLPELGAGLAQFIIVLASASIKKPKYILIDEPELHLHPSLQLDFLTTLGSYISADGGVLFATHSVGLSKTASDKAYSIQKIAHGKSEIREVNNYISLTTTLGELSYSGYREIGFDTVLLVEGTHDIKTFQQFLRLYNMEHKVVILSLGGGSLINSRTIDPLRELSKIAPHTYAVIDSEKDKEESDLDEERQGFIKNCGELGINCHVLERRATENYLTTNALRIVKGNSYEELGPFELLKDKNPSWGKKENWLIARNMRLDEIENTDLGKFIKSFSV
ncbi:MAG: AAA family ATPase [Candidatus Pacebacteria bacterium]|nr:AAA family ATPase [Candidatus Paceibacterota bacterium]